MITEPKSTSRFSSRTERFISKLECLGENVRLFGTFLKLNIHSLVLSQYFAELTLHVELIQEDFATLLTLILISTKMGKCTYEMTTVFAAINSIDSSSSSSGAK
jgi:hypothetical protein